MILLGIDHQALANPLLDLNARAHIQLHAAVRLAFDWHPPCSCFLPPTLLLPLLLSISALILSHTILSVVEPWVSSFQFGVWIDFSPVDLIC